MRTQVSQAHRPSLALLAREPAGHYTVSKLLDLHQYIERTNPWQAIVTIVSTPLPGLVATLLPAFLPLRPLRYGADTSFYGHLFFIVFFITAGTVVSSLCVTQVPSSAYSLREVLSVSLVCSLIHAATSALLFSNWRFPIPFFWIIGTFLWVMNVSLSHLLVLRSKCWRRPELLAAVKLYGLGLLIQVLQVVIYPAISVLFDHVGGYYQIGITLLLPLVKIIIKRCLKYVTRDITDQHGVVVVSAVEICSSLYQSMIMQSAPSYVALTVLMVLDVVHGLVSIKFFLDRPASVPRKQLVPKALSMLRKQRVTPSKTSAREAKRSAVGPTVESLARARMSKAGKPSARTSSRMERRLIINQALIVTHVAETILLVEYFEVVVPLLNCVFLLITSPLPSALSNTRLRVFHTSPSKMTKATRSILLYAGLQALSFLVMHAVMKFRYGLSAGYHLAFVLTRHRVPIQGKMIAWLPVILYFTTAQYGTDFSFQFEFQTWDQW